STLRRLTVWRERHSVQFYTYLVSGMRQEILPRLLWEEQVRPIVLLRIRHDTRQAFTTVNQVVHSPIHQCALLRAVQQEIPQTLYGNTVSSPRIDMPMIHIAPGHSAGMASGVQGLQWVYAAEYVV